MREYYLPQHVFVSFLDESCIWLDTRIDKFRCTRKDECQCLCNLVEGWPLVEGQEHVDMRTTEEAREVADSLVRQGLLTKSGTGKSAAPPRLNNPKRSLSRQLANPPPIRWHHIASFILAWLLTVSTFTLGSLRLALSTVKRRKALGERWATGACPDDTCNLVYVYMRLRIRFYSSKNKCLFDSFTLANFLAWYRKFPALVIGVSEVPFRAHGYLQEDDVVLNDEVDHVKEFQPVAVF
jgi:Transglutaminase-like superfamily